MFDFVRQHTRLALGFMLLLIIPSFIFFGVQGYSRFTDGSTAAVASVDGRDISREDWDNAHKRALDQVRRQSPSADLTAFDTPALRKETLDGMVRDRVLLAAADKLQLYPTLTRMARIFDNDPQFAGLRGADGRINRELLAMQGMSPEMFDARLRQDLATRQVVAGVALSVPAVATAASAALDAYFQRREVQVQRFDSAAYRAKVNPSDADIEAAYQAAQASFKAPEQAAIEYVVLDLDLLARGLTIGEAELRRAYDERKAQFTQPEERRASHILVKAERDAPAAEREQARAKAQALLAQLRQNPGQFAELARKQSDDAGSAAKGGDLDFFGRGSMVKPFEDTVFKLKTGELSTVVETDFGFHVMTVTAVRGGQTQPFESVRAALEADLRKAQAQKQWAESAEQFTNTVYEQSDSLKPAADKLKLEIRKATVLRTPAPGTEPALANTRFLDAVFGTDALRNKRNTDAVETGRNQLVAARVLSHQPARLLALAEVRDGVRERVVLTQAAAAARADGVSRIAALKAAPAEALGASVVVSRVDAQGLPKPLLEAVLAADSRTLPAVQGVDLGAQGYVVVRILKVLPREPMPGGDAPLRDQYAQAWAAAEADAYVGSLKKRFKATIQPAAAAAAEALSASAPKR